MKRASRFDVEATLIVALMLAGMIFGVYRLL